jgi:hypothetical protein
VVSVLKPLEVREDPNAKSREANLAILTDDPESPEISLRVLAYF